MSKAKKPAPKRASRGVSAKFAPSPNSPFFIEKGELPNLKRSLKSIGETDIANLTVHPSNSRHGAAGLSSYVPGNVAGRTTDKFGYMFRVDQMCKLPYTPENRQLLETLGKNMLDLTGQNDPDKDSRIDAGYTYFGQFVDHDITFDVQSNIDVAQNATGLTNFRTPNFDLDSVYGRGPALDPFLYENPGTGGRLSKLLIGRNDDLFGGAVAADFDLPRNSEGIAMIGDPRNDENLFIAQLHLGFLKFHNRVVDELVIAHPTLPDSEIFKIAQTEVRRHYQYIALNDFIRTIAGGTVVDDILTNGIKFFKPQNVATAVPTLGRNFFMPVEFSVGAYRFGHSMIRDLYRFNQFFSNSGFFWAFVFTKRVIPNNWIVNWNNFFSAGGHVAENKARKIDTRVALNMGNLDGQFDPPPVMPANFMSILSARNLVRGMALGVPSGQCVAKAMNIAPLTDEQLQRNPFAAPDAQQTLAHQNIVNALNANGQLLLKNTPLWFYILKEAEVLQGGNQLGPVGGRIVAEVLISLMKEDENSILNDTRWQPRFGVSAGQPYKIADFLRFAGMMNITGIN